MRKRKMRKRRTSKLNLDHNGPSVKWTGICVYPSLKWIECRLFCLCFYDCDRLFLMNSVLLNF